MALPKLNVPKYKLKLPSDGKTIVNFRPFLVKEEKLLLVATETGDQSELLETIKTIIKDCTDLTDIERLSTFDVEYLFLQIRTKSVGESVEASVICPDDGETEVKISIPLDEIKVVKDKKHKKEIKLSDEIIVTLDYPRLDTFVKMNFADEGPGVDDVFEMAAECLATIADSEQVYDCADATRAEKLEFLDNLNSKQFGMIQEFFETMPKLSHKVSVTNPNTNKVSEVTLEGLASFFACFLLHTNLRAYYEGNFALMHHHKWNIEYIDNLMPWEKEIYVNLLVNFLKEEENRMKEQKAAGGLKSKHINL